MPPTGIQALLDSTSISGHIAFYAHSLFLKNLRCVREKIEEFDMCGSEVFQVSQEYLLLLFIWGVPLCHVQYRVTQIFALFLLMCTHCDTRRLNRGGDESLILREILHLESLDIGLHVIQGLSKFLEPLVPPSCNGWSQNQRENFRNRAAKNRNRREGRSYGALGNV